MDSDPAESIINGFKRRMFGKSLELT